MRFFITFLFLLALSCAHSPYYAETPGGPTRQCVYPGLYAISSDVPESHRIAIVKSVEYWNAVTNTSLFFTVGVVDMDIRDPLTNGLLIIGMGNEEELRNNAAAMAWFKYETRTGCMGKLKIAINPRILEKDIEVFETIMRHEAGHILGLGHSDLFTDLMYPHYSKGQQHPVDASELEIKTVKKLYKKKKFKQEK